MQIVKIKMTWTAIFPRENTDFTEIIKPMGSGIGILVKSMPNQWDLRIS